MRPSPPALHVFDASGLLLETFDDADKAHRFAHDTSLAPGTRLPVEVADLRSRTSSFVRPGYCQSVRWLAVERNEECTLPAAEPGGLFTVTVGVHTSRVAR